MASRGVAILLRNAAANGGAGLRRWAQPAPLNSAMDSVAPAMSLPEYDNNIEPSFSFIEGSMELMAVPKKKVSKHKRGIRNGPKALKPVPVIIRCKVCGQVKLPHVFCCRGIIQSPGEEN